ncbi:3-keto-5-aminohexanoate cleavage protein [Pollutimonas sp. H1-120]|uniref:3-keto-5-aminohexanoate cleavage protein n=1 Tax=Pollutimonas sp. H1-120 TaxID=3148824 RepID=UPI003B52F227
MSRKVWLEVALNGGWTRGRQPLIPVAPQEIIQEAIACVRAGASVVHLHTYDESSGRQNDDPDIFESIVKGILRECDAIVYPTVGQHPENPDSPIRYAPIKQLAEKGLLEWSVVDPGSVNFSLVSELQQNRSGYVYVNSEQHVRNGLMLAKQYGYHPSYAIYEPGFLRLGAALFKHMTGVPVPIYRFMFTDVFAFGLPPEEFALDAYLRLLDREHPRAPWMTAGRCTDISALIKPTVHAGGHIRVGLEDAPLGTNKGNLEWVERAVELIQKAGGSPASASDVRSSVQKL